MRRREEQRQRGARSAGGRSRRSRAPRSSATRRSSTMLRSPGSSTRPARESTITTRAGPMSRQKLQRVPSTSRSALEDEVAAGSRCASLRLVHAARRRRPRRARAARGCRVLVDPVRHEAADDAVVPPARARASSVTQSIDVFQSSWTSWSSKIIAEGTVESSQRIVRLAPRLPVQPRVLLEVGDRLARRHLGVAARADELAHVRARPRRRRPGRRAAAARAATPTGSLLGASAARARAARRPRGRRGARPCAASAAARAARQTRQEPKTIRARPVRVVGADDARRERAVGLAATPPRRRA